MYNVRLIQLKESRKLKQNDIAKLLNMTRGSYCHYETEDDILPIKYMNILANFFGVSLDFLFSFTDNENYNLSKKEIDSINSGNRLKEFRKMNKITQLKLAEILKSDNSTISKYEKGKNFIATPFLYDICKRYNISADYLLGKIDFIPDWCDNYLKK